MASWFVRDPDRLNQELAALTAAGIKYEIDEEQKDSGILKLRLAYPHKDTPVALVATYPDLFPYFKPEVEAPDLSLDRHQGVLGKTLCLLGRRTHHWHVTDTLAGILAEKMADVLAYAETGDREAIQAVEEPQGEPLSEAFNGVAPAGSYLLFDSSWEVPASVRRGILNIRCRWQKAEKNGGEDTLQGYIDSITDETGSVLCQWTGPQLGGDFRPARVRWARANRRFVNGWESLMEAVSDDRDWLISFAQKSTTMRDTCFAVLFEEEVTQDQYADGWLAFQLRQPRRKKGRVTRAEPRPIQTFRAGPDDLFARMPGWTRVREKTAAVFGLGAIGAPVAIELARHGIGRLKVIDHDIVDPATIRRWPIGVPAFGDLKCKLVAGNILHNYPWTDVVPFDVRIGTLPPNEGPRTDQRDLIWDIIKDCDIVIDCTAELGVNHFLSDLTVAGGIPYVMANATPGVWGGMVARFQGGDPCWMCMRHAFYGDSPALILPPEAPEDYIQPPGCADPTFTGRACDLAEISLQTVRQVLGLLAGDRTSSIQSSSLLTLALRTDKGSIMPPAWTAQNVPKRRGCTCRHT